MHTLNMIVAGLVLLAVFHLARRWLTRTHGGPAGHVTLFLAVWLIAAVVNAAIGVVVAGYSVAAEAGIALVVFGVPAAVALGLRFWLLRKS